MQTRAETAKAAPKADQAGQAVRQGVAQDGGAALRQARALADASPRVAGLRVLQRKADAYAASTPAGRMAVVQRQRQAGLDRTGLPDRLKAGVEALSGTSLDAVRVHYNSSQPAQLNAHAFTQGAEIHVGPGQERHLRHEAWHAVQQAQGRVRATTQLKGLEASDDAALEAEADRMGAKAAALGRAPAFEL